MDKNEESKQKFNWFINEKLGDLQHEMQHKISSIILL